MWKTLSIIILSLAVIATSSAQTGVQSLSAQEAAACTGFDTVASGKKCTKFFKAHECNVANSVTNCSGGDATECKTCRVAGEEIKAKAWMCRPKKGWECNVNDNSTADCGTEWKGTCFLDEGTEEWFCQPTADTTKVCTKELKKICN